MVTKPPKIFQAEQIAGLRAKWKRRNKIQLEETHPRWNHDYITLVMLGQRAGVCRRTLFYWLKKGYLPTPRKRFYMGRPMWAYLFTDAYAEALRGLVITKNSATWMTRTKEFRVLCHRVLSPLARRSPRRMPVCHGLKNRFRIHGPFHPFGGLKK